LFSLDLMTRKVILALAAVAFTTSVGAQTTKDKVTSDDGRVVVATYAAKPEYPYELRARHIQGAGVFQVHIRADGTVRSVDTIQSTRNALLDKCAIDAFMRWRFRVDRPTKAKIPITFSMHRPY
jgi:TonB family protein